MEFEVSRHHFNRKNDGKKIEPICNYLNKFVNIPIKVHYFLTTPKRREIILNQFPII
jgi:hypothetical protein